MRKSLIFFGLSTLVLMGQLGLSEEGRSHQAPTSSRTVSDESGCEALSKNGAKTIPKLKSPDKSLRPGDILIYTFESAGSELTYSKVKEAPPVFQKALSGFKHAALVFENEEGKIAHADSGMLKPGEEFNFDDGRSYLILRPQVEESKQEEFTKGVNEMAQKFMKLGYAYDPLMQMDFQDPKTRKKLIDDLRTVTFPFRGKSPIPPQSCAELVATILDLNGLPPPNGSTASELLDLAIKHVVETYPESELKPRARDAVDEIVDYFKAFSVESKNELEAEKKQLESLKRKITGSVSLRELTKVERAPIDDVVKGLDQKITGLGYVLKEIDSEISNYSTARSLLKTAVNEKLNAPPSTWASFGDSVVKTVVPAYGIWSSIKDKTLQTALKKRVIRPVDFVREAGTEKYDIIGFHPGTPDAPCPPKDLFH